MARQATAPVRRPTVAASGALARPVPVAVGSMGPWQRQRPRALREVETLSGLRTDGAPAPIGAMVAVVALLVVLARPARGAAWFALAGLGVSAVTGTANRLFLATAKLAIEAQSQSATFDIAWGLLLVTAAGASGTLSAALVVRQTD